MEIIGPTPEQNKSGQVSIVTLIEPNWERPDL
jgi:hypothetical protein